MIEADSEASPSVVSGQTLIFGVIANALIHSGATNSFASLIFIRRLGRHPEILDHNYCITIPSGEVLCSNKILKACVVIIEGREIYVDLVVLEIEDFEVILGMDWLSKYRAAIDFNNKTVTFQLPGEKKFTFVGTNKRMSLSIISAMKASKLLRNGCIAYLASVVDVSVEQKVKPEDVHVVNEFVDVFPKDLPGIPPDREIDFVIDVLPGTAPISKAPYRMAPLELKELKIQLQELLDK